MKRYIALLMVLFLSACSTMQVNVDYAPEYDFSKIKSFAVVHKTKENENGLTNERIINALNEVLSQKGLKKSDPQHADIIFLFHLNIQNKTEIYTDYQMVGYGRYGGMLISVPTTYSYDEGRLIIDAYDPKLNKTVFRAEVIDELDHHKTPKEREAYILKVVKSALKNFPPKRSKQ